MIDSIKVAIDASDALAIVDMKGPEYNRLREALSLIEGCCRQASVWREDTRWLPIGLYVSGCHDRAGGWLRGHKNPLSGIRTAMAAKQKNQMFLMLSGVLKLLLKGVENLKDQRTGRVGMILPEMPNLGRPQGMLIPASKPGLILPGNMTRQ